MAEFDYSEAISEARAKYESISKALDVDRLTAEAKDLEVKAAEPGLWDDPENAQKVTSKLSAVQSQLKRLASADQRIEDVETLVELGQEEEDADTLAEAKAEVESIQKDLDDMEIQTLLDGEYDERSAVVTIRSGAGGVDAADFAQMLLRMYLRWAERKGLDVELDEVSAGSEAGISSATFMVKGRHAYGLLRSEHGVHRLVRMSPFNAQGKRQTAFAALKVTPFLEDVPDIEVDDKDLRIDTYRSSGAGGQHVNVTDSAVRITHLPTGVVTSCQNERSQHQNKDRAMQILKAKLAELERQKREDELAAIRGEQRSVGFGSQIRSYVMQPYQMVKDLRSEHETGNVDSVLDGSLDQFMEAFLRWQRAESLGSV